MFPYLFVESLRKWEWRFFIKAFFIIPFVFLLFWIIIFHSLENLGTYLKGIFELAKGNSESAGLYPENNWWILGSCLLFVGSIPFWIKEKEVRFFWLWMLPAVFVVLKHSMARQDPWHVIIFFAFLLLLVALMLAVSQKIRWYYSFLFLPAILFYMNIQVSLGMFTGKFALNGVVRFYDTFWNYNKNLQQSREIFKKENAPFILDEEIREIIGNATIDCYPWNYAFVPANSLNFHPRPIIQSYASYTPWLDAQNAAHFSSDEAPEFIIWELDVKKRDPWNAQLTSIDQHYLLSDEPQTIQTILNNYKLIHKEENYLLLKQMKKGLLKTQKRDENITIKWNEWVKVPFLGDGILRAKLLIKKSFFGNLKGFLLKDAAYMIEYLHENGEVRKYRFTPQNAKSGLWINPYISRPSNGQFSSLVKSIRFSCSDNQMVLPSFSLVWECVQLQKISEKKDSTNPYSHTYSLFGKDQFRQDSLILFSRNDFHQSENSWQSQTFTADTVFATPQGNYFKIHAGGYSPAFSLPVDSTFSSCIVKTGFLFKMPYRAIADVVISVEDAKNQSIFWKGKLLDKFMIVPNQWSPLSWQITLPNMLPKGSTLKVYIWNKGKQEVFVDNMEVEVMREVRGR